MSPAIRRARADAYRAWKGVGCFGDAARSTPGRTVAGYYLLHPAALYATARRRPRPPRLHLNHHAVDRALYVGAWGSHVCRPFHVPSVGATPPGEVQR